MSHQEKQEIFDKYNKYTNKETFEEFLMYTLFEVANNEISKKTAINQIKSMVFAACDLVQEEQQKRIAENAKITVVNSIYKWQGVDKSSIINPENLIK